MKECRPGIKTRCARARQAYERAAIESQAFADEVADFVTVGDDGELTTVVDRLRAELIAERREACLYGKFARVMAAYKQRTVQKKVAR